MVWSGVLSQEVNEDHVISRQHWFRMGFGARFLMDWIEGRMDWDGGPGGRGGEEWEGEEDGS